jgi:hypothetical protein
MEFVNQLLRGIEFVPALVNGIEALFGDRPGQQKKEAAMSFLENALALRDATATRDVVNTERLKEGISMIVDGVVRCMNASGWAQRTSGENPGRRNDG